MAAGADRSWGYGRPALSATVPQGDAFPARGWGTRCVYWAAEPPRRTDPAEAGGSAFGGNSWVCVGVVFHDRGKGTADAARQRKPCNAPGDRNISSIGRGTAVR